MNRSYVLAALVAVGVAAWLLSGEFVGAGDHAGAVPTVKITATETTPTSVRVRQSIAESRLREVVIRGRTGAERRVELKAEIQARVVAIPVNKGARVKAGQIVAHLAIDDRAARLDEAKALARQREVEMAAAKELTAKGFRPANKMAESEALLDAARAAVVRLEVEVSKTVITAPFDGIIDDLPIEIGTFLKSGDPVAIIVDEDPFLVWGQVSERDVALVKVGGTGVATLITGQRIEGRVRFISTTADPTTRTFKVELEVPNPDGVLRDGVSAEIRLPTVAILAHKVSPALLILNDKGVVGVRAVNGDGIVEFHPAQLLNDGPDGVWLGDLPERLNIIVVGQEFVREGEKVRAVPLIVGSGS
jgi:multidrug efflux system membrane fusion protein